MNIPIPNANIANKRNNGIINKVSHPTDAPNMNIRTPNGINESKRLIEEDIISEIGKMMVGTLMDFKIPLASITELTTVTVTLEKKFQNMSPVSANSG